MYICAQTLTLFFIARKSQTIHHEGERKKMKTILYTKSLRLITFAITLLCITGMTAQRGYGQERKVVNLSSAKGLPFSDGVVAGNTLYIAGQEGEDDAGKLVAGGIGPETTAALANIQKVLKAAGFDLKDVVSVTVYLADIHEFGEMNKIYKDILPDPKPARATIQAAALVNNARIEISAIAVKRK
jgi:2-iminobutanoate/2-iminopropanoate deaminase